MIKLVILKRNERGRFRECVIKLSNTDLQQFMQLNYEETEDLIKERYISNFEELISFEWRVF